MKRTLTPKQGLALWRRLLELAKYDKCGNIRNSFYRLDYAGHSYNDRRLPSYPTGLSNIESGFPDEPTWHYLKDGCPKTLTWKLPMVTCLHANKDGTWVWQKHLYGLCPWCMEKVEE